VLVLAQVEGHARLCERPRVFVCGPTGFVEQVADALVDLGHAPDAIHAERFGPTG
jgi:ferredoxin-NADP reductase